MGESMGFTSAVLTPDTHVKGLSGGERQGLAIVRALHFEAEVIILDEPTMGLSLKETDKLLQFVSGIRAANKSAIFIDHNIFHVYSVADRIMLLDRGRIAGDFPTSRYTLEELTGIMRELAERRFTDPERIGRTKQRWGIHERTPTPRELTPAARRARRVLRLLGIADRHHRRVLCSVGVVHRLRASDLPGHRDLPVLCADDAVFRDRRHAADDGHRGRRHRPVLPVRHGPGHGRFRMGMAGNRQHGAGCLRGNSRRLLWGLFNGAVITLIGLPALVVTIGTQFLFRG